VVSPSEHSRGLLSPRSTAHRPPLLPHATAPCLQPPTSRSTARQHKQPRAETPPPKRSLKTALHPAGAAAFVCRGRLADDNRHRPPSNYATNPANFARPPCCSPTPPSAPTATGQPASQPFSFGREHLHADRLRRSPSGAVSSSTSFAGSPCASPVAQASASAAPPLPHRHPLRLTARRRGADASGEPSLLPTPKMGSPPV
jgi:hypothetical protein